MTNKLTAQQEAFCKCIADGMNQSDAYRSAYDATNTTDKSVNELASRAMKNVKIASRVKELKSKLENKQLWSREHSVKVLANIALQKDAQLSAKVSAVKELNLMHGYNEPTSLNISGPNGKPIEFTGVQFVGVSSKD